MFILKMCVLAILVVLLWMAAYGLYRTTQNHPVSYEYIGTMLWLSGGICGIALAQEVLM